MKILLSYLFFVYLFPLIIGLFSPKIKYFELYKNYPDDNFVYLFLITSFFIIIITSYFYNKFLKYKKPIKLFKVSINNIYIISLYIYFLVIGIFSTKYGLSNYRYVNLEFLSNLELLYRINFSIIFVISVLLVFLNYEKKNISFRLLIYFSHLFYISGLSSVLSIISLIILFEYSYFRDQLISKKKIALSFFKILIFVLIAFFLLFIGLQVKEAEKGNFFQVNYNKLNYLVNIDYFYSRFRSQSVSSYILSFDLINNSLDYNLYLKNRDLFLSRLSRLTNKNNDKLKNLINKKESKEEIIDQKFITIKKKENIDKKLETNYEFAKTTNHTIETYNYSKIFTITNFKSGATPGFVASNILVFKEYSFLSLIFLTIFFVKIFSYVNKKNSKLDYLENFLIMLIVFKGILDNPYAIFYILDETFISFFLILMILVSSIKINNYRND